MTIEVIEYTCESCGSDYVLRYDSEEVDYEPISCPFCSEEVSTESGVRWEDIAIFDQSSDDEYLD